MNPKQLEASLRYMTEIAEMDSAGPVYFQTDRLTLMCVIGALHLACRHPLYRGPEHPSREIVLKFIDALKPSFGPMAQRVIDMGMDQQFDGKFENPVPTFSILSRAKKQTSNKNKPRR